MIRHRYDAASQRILDTSEDRGLRGSGIAEKILGENCDDFRHVSTSIFPIGIALVASLIKSVRGRRD